jgi:hypothetical protein
LPNPAVQQAQLQLLSGHYSGQVSTWLNPDAAPDVSVGELHISPIAGGRWLRFEQLGTVAGTAHAGELLLAYHDAAGEYEVCWVDSFHTGCAMMQLVGSARTDRVVIVAGEYDSGAYRWGWRTELHPGDSFLRIDCFNISPAGQEFRAIASLWTRL